MKEAMKSNTKINCTELAKKAGISKAMVSQIFLGKKKAGWKSAKRLAAATGTDPVLWLEGTPNEIKQAITEESDTLIKN
jgi:transcriptional regulator with XRE-family HTH domain